MNKRFILLLIMFILGSSFYSAWNQVNSRRLPAWLSVKREPTTIHEINAERLAPEPQEADTSADDPFLRRTTKLDTTFSVCKTNSGGCRELMLRLRIQPALEELPADYQEPSVLENDSLRNLRAIEIQLAAEGSQNWTRKLTKIDFAEEIDKNWFDLYQLAGLGRPIFNYKFNRLLLPVELAASDESDETVVLLEFDLAGALHRVVNSGNCAGGAQLNASETALLTCSGLVKFESDTFAAFEQPKTAFVSFLNDTAYAVVIDDQYYSAIFGNCQIRSLSGDTLFTYNFAGYTPGPKYLASAGTSAKARAQVYYNDDYGEVILFYDDRPRRPRHFALPELRRFDEAPPGAYETLKLATPGGRAIAFYFDERRGLLGYTGGVSAAF